MATSPKLHHYVFSDLHLGHEGILKYGRGELFASVEAHNDYIINSINETCGEDDYLWLLGDVAFNTKGLDLLKKVKCNLALVGGNHDRKSIQKYLEVFNQVSINAILQQEFEGSLYIIYFSHIPIHGDEMYRFDYNFHGHLHQELVRIPSALDTVNNFKPVKIDTRYINCCCEQLNYKPALIYDLIRGDME